MISKPPGVYLLSFCTVSAPLSQVALLAFAGGSGLPSGFADPVPTPVIQLRTPAGTRSEPPVLTDADGLYHAVVEMLEEGEWQWEGQGWTNTEELICSTGIIPWLIGPAIKA